ncbi:hypothetical protein KP509_04G001400 [Ceratopteris richardii]|uniref:Peroxidase n=1 Tax=Ceratopteris richardii TaxID=49495 RepID=A0A8T2UW27_CERRI|nr:hypothetical protein KP509_04G001400 [Ceratopteris richardii]
MRSSTSMFSFLLISMILLAITSMVLHSTCMAHPPPLRKGFYSASCPDLERIVLRVMRDAVVRNPRNAAYILRLFFHDCFVQGCDGSVLLDDVLGLPGEKGAFPNKNFAEAFLLVDAIKREVEHVCPAAVSCADILALASRDAVVLTGGPHWEVALGRRDAVVASLKLANIDIPTASYNLSTLISIFRSKGLSVEDMVALSGAHTIGFARCFNYKERLYNQSGTLKPDPNLNVFVLRERMMVCPPIGGDGRTYPLDRTPFVFDTSYYKDLIRRSAVLYSDQVLESVALGPGMPLVNWFAGDARLFFERFSEAMTKMGSINPLTGFEGEIRRNCRLRN